LGWILLSAGLFHLHYTTVFLPVAEVAFLALMAALSGSTPGHYRVRHLIVDLAVIGALGVPVLPRVLEVASMRGNWERFPSPVSRILTVYPLHTYVFLPAALGAFFAADRIARQRGWEQVYRPVVFCACWLLVPLCAAWILNQLDLARVFARRFLI